MNGDWSPIAVDAQRSAALILHPTATPLQVLLGTATDDADLSPYATRVQQSAGEVTATVTWHTQLNGANQPRAGQVLECRLGAQPLWIGIIEAISDYRHERGTRQLGITARSRDGGPLWRDTQRVTPVYSAGTPLSYIARQVAQSLGLSDAENLLGEVAAYTQHSNTQLANLTAWDMLTALYLPSGREPWVDAVGRLKTISRDVARPADIVLTSDRVKAITGSRSRPSTTAVRLKWLDASLSKVTKQDQSLAVETLTAGFFQPEVKKDVKFSQDGTQRAEGTRLVIKQSCNNGLLRVADEIYEQLTQTGGRIRLINTYYSALFVTGALAGVAAAGNLPDYSLTTGGPTIPTGKVAQAALLLLATTAMSSIGTGTYEIWGQPYDYVHARNTTEAYDESAPAWLEQIKEIESDLVTSQANSEAVASRELRYEVRSATSYGATLVDDPRIERGDILEFPDASRLYVTNYKRDLSRSATALLDVEGFRA